MSSTMPAYGCLDEESAGGSIVEDPFCEGDSPQWRHCTRSSNGDDNAVRDEGTQTTDDLDGAYLQKSRALQELEEDIAQAQAQRNALRDGVVETAAPSPCPCCSTLTAELALQRSAMSAMQVELSHVRLLIEALLQKPSTQSDCAP